MRGELARKRRPGPSYKLWIIEDLDDWTTIERFEINALDEKWRMERNMDSKIHKLITKRK